MRYLTVESMARNHAVPSPLLPFLRRNILKRVATKFVLPDFRGDVYFVTVIPRIPQRVCYCKCFIIRVVVFTWIAA